VQSAEQIRETFLSFFEEKGHRRVASASLVPESDPSLLFVNAGMVPFKRMFLGEEAPPAARATGSQKCMRVSGKHNDLEEVGKSPRHHTFFEMLGNFSFGDYFKREAILFAWELVTQRFGLAAEDLVVSVFREDDEAAEIWEREVGLPPHKIYRLGESENFWSMGETGPCGPCSEIHLDRGPLPGVPDDDPGSDSGRFLEFWNLVFMQFERDAKCARRPLPKPSVDTGAGLERLCQILQGARDNYGTDLFAPILARVQDLSGVSFGGDAQHDISLRVVADHARATAFLVGDGVLPSNGGRGYVLRRILRRAMRHGVLLGLKGPFLCAVTDAVTDAMGGAFPELIRRRDFIRERVRREEERFLATLGKGLQLLEAEIAEIKAQNGAALPGALAFKLYDTYGFPLDLTQDILAGHGLAAGQEAFAREMEAQRARSREAWRGSGDAGVAQVYGRMAAELASEFVGYETLECEAPVQARLVNSAPVDCAESGSEVEVVVSETPFYAEGGGQVGDRGAIETASGRVRIADTLRPAGDLVVHRGVVETGCVRAGESARLSVDAGARAATVRNHSGTHLLHAALHQVIGPQALQQGSLVAPDRLRFDFTHDAPLSEEQMERIEDLVNEWILQNAPSRVQRMGYQDALAAGAVALFEEKYGEDVRVVSFGEVSSELCGGTHAQSSGEIGLFKIVSESGIAAGVRRIEAQTGQGALRHLRAQQHILQRVGELLRTAPANYAELPQRIEKLLAERGQAQHRHFQHGEGIGSPGEVFLLAQQGAEHAAQPGGLGAFGKRAQRLQLVVRRLHQILLRGDLQHHQIAQHAEQRRAQTPGIGAGLPGVAAGAQRCGGFAGHAGAGDFVQHAAVNQIQQLGDALVFHLAAAAGDELVEQSERIAQRAVARPRHFQQAGARYLDGFGLGDFCQPRRDFRRGNAPQVVALAARGYGEGNLLGIRGAEQEQALRRRLFQRFEQRVEGRPREHMHLVHDEDAPLARRGVDVNRFDDLADIVHAGAAGGVNLPHIRRVAVLDIDADRVVQVGGIAGAAVVVQAACENARQRGLAGAARPCEQNGVGNAPAADGIAQRRGHMGLPRHFVKSVGPPLARQHLVRQCRSASRGPQRPPSPSLAGRRRGGLPLLGCLAGQRAPGASAGRGGCYTLPPSHFDEPAAGPLQEGAEVPGYAKPLPAPRLHQELQEHRRLQCGVEGAAGDFGRPQRFGQEQLLGRTATDFRFAEYHAGAGAPRPRRCEGCSPPPARGRRAAEQFWRSCRLCTAIGQESVGLFRF